MIYTSYFAMGRKIPGTIKRISIAPHPPKGWTGASYPLLTPNYDLDRSFRKGTPGDERCDNEYRQYVLRHVKPEQVVYDLEALGNSRDCVLMTLEGFGRFSCRETLRKWLNEHGEPCEEWVDPDFERKRKEREAVTARKMEIAAAAGNQLSFF